MVHRIRDCGHFPFTYRRTGQSVDPESEKISFPESQVSLRMFPCVTEGVGPGSSSYTEIPNLPLGLSHPTPIIWFPTCSCGPGPDSERGCNRDRRTSSWVNDPISFVGRVSGVPEERGPTRGDVGAVVKITPRHLWTLNTPVGTST